MTWVPCSIVALCLLAACETTVRMPGQSFRGTLPVASLEEQRLASALRADVHMLAAEIGERNARHATALTRAEAYVHERLEASRVHGTFQDFTVGSARFRNVVALIPPASPVIDDQVIVVGAHHDSAPGTPGANDNGSGVAAMLALAERFGRAPAHRTFHFVAFTNEEPPHFGTPAMGSRVYVQRARATREMRIGAMISLETMGYYSEAPGSQKYPWPLGWFYPDRGNFIAVVANDASRDLVRSLVGTFRAQTQFPIEGTALPRAPSRSGGPTTARSGI